MNFSKEHIFSHLNNSVFKTVGSVADSLGRECFVVGGYVRDIFLERKSKDIDFVTVGSGIEVAELVAQTLGKHTHLSVFKNFGTAQVKHKSLELEFVGARKESYSHDSRKPIVENGTLHDDQCRRDFTINAMAISVNSNNYGELLDPFNGIDDLKAGIIRTPLNPDITFSDDPLRMMRAIRFATQLNFNIYEETFAAISRNCKRIKIISKERIVDELMKIMKSATPSRGFNLLSDCGLLDLIMPELCALKGIDTINGRAHKDNFKHTMQVLDNVAAKSDNVWLRWAALFHDIGKPATKHYDATMGWTFHNHNFIGEKMIPSIFARMKLPQNEHMKYVKKLVGLHMRPIALVEDEVTDSAVRRMLFEAGDDIDDLMTLCEADITSKNQEKVKRFLDNFAVVRQKLVEIEEKDRIRNFQPPVDGMEIMTTFGLEPCGTVGLIKERIKNAILDGIIANDYDQAREFMFKVAQELGLVATTPANASICYQCVAFPIGNLFIASFHESIVAICFTLSTIEGIARKIKATIIEKETGIINICHKQLDEYFSGSRKSFELPLQMIGTEFQKQVWGVISTIAYGDTISYKEEARILGNPRAIRAVASANGANPIAIVIPCHRVIGNDGSLVGYAGGLDIKKALLKIENALE